MPSRVVRAAELGAKIKTEAGRETLESVQVNLLGQNHSRSHQPNSKQVSATVNNFSEKTNGGQDRGCRVVSTEKVQHRPRNR